MHYELPTCAFLAAFLVLVPLPWHWRARNVATLSIIAWLFIFNIIYGVNTTIWAGNVRQVAVIWCDIATKIHIGGNIALPACCLALCIHLERIASLRNAHSTPSSKRWNIAIDIGLCWVLPLIYMALHYIVQGHRFDILEDFGCRPTTYNSVASIFLIWLPPMVCVIATLILASMCLYHFFQRRITFARHLQQSNTALTTSRYFRLITMSIVQMFWGLGVMSLMMAFTLASGLRPWISWGNVHSDWLRIDLYPTILIPPKLMLWTYLMWWAIPISSLLFFVFFAFGEDAMKEYSLCFNWVVDRTWRTVNRKTNSSKKTLILPTHISKPIPLDRPPLQPPSLHLDLTRGMYLSSSMSSTFEDSTVYSPEGSKSSFSTAFNPTTSHSNRPESQFSMTNTNTSDSTIVHAPNPNSDSKTSSPPKYYYAV